MIWQRAWSRKDHGKSHDAVFNRAHPPGFRWLHESFGTNYRMTGIQAALGLRQLERLPDWIAIRAANAAILMRACRQSPGLRTPAPPDHIGHAWYRFYTFIEPEHLRPGWDRDRILEAITARGVSCFAGSCSEIYRERAFAQAGLGPRKPLPVAKQLGETSLAFLVDPCQDQCTLEAATRTIADVMSEATGARQATGLARDPLAHAEG